MERDAATRSHTSSCAREGTKAPQSIRRTNSHISTFANWLRECDLVEGRLELRSPVFLTQLRAAFV
jgi:hypothetical protein